MLSYLLLRCLVYKYTVIFGNQSYPVKQATIALCLFISTFDRALCFKHHDYDHVVLIRISVLFTLFVLLRLVLILIDHDLWMRCEVKNKTKKQKNEILVICGIRF